MRPLFLIGNKRSGTSHLVRMLNLHPSVAVTHESDIVWILFRLSKGLPIEPYPNDGDAGLNATLEAAADLLDPTGQAFGEDELRSLFRAVQLRVLRSGSAVQRPQALEREPLWLGDKKPVQQADPEVLRFTSSLFPDARYVHIVRHPAGAVASMLRRGRKGAAVGFWQRGDAEEVIQRWGVHERWALAASDRVAVHRLRYEDLVRDPVSQGSLLGSRPHG